MTTGVSLLLLVQVVVVFAGLCGAEERGVLASDHAEPCEIDILMTDGSALRAPILVPLDLSAVAAPGAPRLVWHCGTPDPSPPSVEALTAAVRAALRFRAPPAG